MGLRVLTFCLLGLLALCGTSVSQGADASRRDAPAPAPGRAVVRYSARAPILDGRDNEWLGVPALRLDRRSQLVDTGLVDWRGPSDASASIRLLYDEAHLYAFVRLVDADPLVQRHGESWQSGDVLELFFDTDLRDAALGELAWNDDDLQLMILPHSESRPWASIVPPESTAALGSTAALTDRGFSGIRVVRQQQDDGVALEIAIPLHNLPGLAPGTSEIGFNVAFGDRDPGRESYNYVLWTGGASPARETRNFGRLRFEGPAVLSPRPRRRPGAAWAFVGTLLGALLPAMIVLIVLLVARHAYQRSLAGREQRTWVVTRVAIAIAVAGVALPPLVSVLRENAMRTRARDVAAWVQTSLPLMERGSFGKLQGASRDQPLVDILSGGEFRRPTQYEYVSLGALAPEALGWRSQSFADGTTIWPYRLPLNADGSLLRVGEGQLAERLFFVVSEEIDGERKLEGAELLLSTGDVSEFSVVLEPLLDSDLAPPLSSRVFWIAEIGAAEVGTEFTLRAPADRSFVLEGLSTHSAMDIDRRPVFLQTTSRLGVGVPTELVGAYPTDTGVRVEPGTVWRFEVPRALRDVEKVWMMFAGIDNPAFRETSDGAAVGNVVLGCAGPGGSTKPRVFALRHQQEIFSRRFDVNSEAQRLGTTDTASVAYEWEANDGAKQITPGFAFDLGGEGGAEVRTLALANTGKYPIELREVVFASALRDEAGEPSDSPVVATIRGGSLRLADSALTRVADARFFVFREGLLSGFRGVDESRRLPLEVRKSLVSTNEVDSDGIFGTASYETWVRLPAEGWGDAVLAVSVRDAALGGSTNWLFILGTIATILALPWLLVHFLQTVAPVGSLRVQLLGSVAFAAIVTLVLLSLFLVQRLEQSQVDAQRTRVLADLEVAQRRLDETSRELAIEARDQGRKLVASIRREQGEGEQGEGELATVSRDELRSALRESLALARPKGWSEASFLAAELPDPATEKRMMRVVDRDASRMLGDTPLGPDAGLYLRWGKLFVGARADVEGGESLRCALGRELDRSTLEAWAARGIVGFFDLDGYPIVVASSSVEEELRTRFERLHSLPGERRALVDRIERLRESGRSDVTQLGEAEDAWVAALALVRDRGGEPIALLGSFARPERASLPLFFASVGVGPFFIIVGSLLLVLVSFMTLSVTGRISRPIASIGQHALRLSRGDMAGELAPLGGSDEVAALNQAFRKMTAELRARIAKQDYMNRAMARLTRALEVDAVAQEAALILTEASGADEGAVLVVQRAAGTLRSQCIAARRDTPLARVDLTELVVGSHGPCCVELDCGREGRMPALLLPLRRRDRSHAAALLAFEGALPAVLDLDCLQALLDQISTVMETSRLYALAIEDATTGLPLVRWFRRRVQQEVDRAQARGTHVSLMRFEIVGSLDEACRDTAGVLAELASRITSALAPNELASRVAGQSFEILIPGVDLRPDAELEAAERARARPVRERFRELELRLDEALQAKLPGKGLRLARKVAVYPEDARSAAFLVSLLDRDVAASAGERKSIEVVEASGGLFASHAMHAVLDQLRRAADTDLTLLIEGETGTGKEVLADYCHANSARVRGPLVKVNCAAIPDTLLESALFGHERGAFTGAVDRHRGFFEQADKGTLVLDEIGEMPLELQAKLLRVLQDGVLRRVGGSQDIAVDVRCVASTHRKLHQRVEQGLFRQDLYFRLQGLTVRVPPLRERREEIPAFVARFARAFGDGARPLSAAAFDALHAHSWPGNVRELQNVLQRAFVLASGERIEPEDLDLIAPEIGVEEALASSEDAEAAPALPSPLDGAAPSRGERVEAESSNGADAGEGTLVLAPDMHAGSREARWESLLKYCTAHPILADEGVSPRQYCELFQVSRRTATRDLGAWLDMGLLESRGQKRSLRYLITKRGA